MVLTDNYDACSDGSLVSSSTSGAASDNIRRALNESLETLDATYDRTLKDIGENNWERARRLFQCVAAASRPLRIEEFAEFLAFDLSSERTRKDWRNECLARTVLTTSSSLFTVVDVDGSQVNQFAQFSVTEFLTSERLGQAKDNISRFHVSMISAHTLMRKLPGRSTTHRWQHD